MREIYQLTAHKDEKVFVLNSQAMGFNQYLNGIRLPGKIVFTALLARSTSRFFSFLRFNAADNN